MQVYAQGQWREAGMKDCRTFDFGPGIGKQICAPLNFPELHPLPQRYGLESLACYAAGFNRLVDCVLFPLGWILSRLGTGLAPRLLGPWLVWAVNRYAKPPWGVILRLEAEGEYEGQPHTCTIELRHPDPWEFTALAVVACLKQYLDGSIAQPGVRMMGDVVDPGRTLEELRHLGAEVTVSTPRAPAPLARV
jgi:saccharopine dehydrogenase (NAD+, L-lysine-forming)